MSLTNGEGTENRSRDLMMRALDGETSEAQEAELNDLLRANEELDAEWRQLRSATECARQLELKKPPDEMWEEYMDSVYRRVERGIGWILLSVGAIVLLTYGAWEGIQKLLGAVTVPWYVKGAVMALLAGIVVLAVSIIREKFFVFKDDPFRDVER